MIKETFINQLFWCFFLSFPNILVPISFRGLYFSTFCPLLFFQETGLAPNETLEQKVLKVLLTIMQASILCLTIDVTGQLWRSSSTSTSRALAPTICGRRVGDGKPNGEKSTLL